MVIGIPGLSMDEYKTHFNMWCISAVPLWIGCDLSVVNESIVEVLSNEEVIRVNQDEWGFGAMQLDGLHSQLNNTEVWWKVLKPQANETVAAAVMLWNTINTGSVEMYLNFWEVGFNGNANVRDLWLHKDLGSMDRYTGSVAPHGSVMLRISQ